MVLLTMVLMACNNKQAASVAVEETQSEVLKAFADSVNSVAPMAWAEIGDIQEVSLEGQELRFIGKARNEALKDPSVKQWFSSFIINNVYLFGSTMQQECLDKNFSMLFNFYTTDRNQIDYKFKLTPTELKKKFKYNPVP